MPGIFDGKYFNAELFGSYRETIPDPTLTAILNSGAVVEDSSLGAMFQDEGGNYAVLPMPGILGGTPDNYDGVANITADSLNSYTQGMVVVGRSHAWTEKDFAVDVTRKDWMEEIARQVNRYWAKVKQHTVLKILAGAFTVTDGSFSTDHTHDISSDGNGKLTPTSLNDGMQKALGDNKGAFALAIMDSTMSTALENMGLLEYAKGTDAQGLQRPLNVAYWNGRVVVVDDGVPTVTGAGGTAHQIFMFGEGAIRHANAPVKVPNEVTRDAMTNGGKDFLITRTRDLWVPSGFNFKKASMATASPTDNELAAAANWGLVSDGSGNFIDTKAVPFGRILALG